MPNQIKQNKRIKGAKAWGIYFKHSLGWTLTEIELDKEYPEIRLKYWRKISPKFKHKIIPVLITPLTKKK